METNLSPEVLRKWGTILIIIFAFSGGGYSLFKTGVSDGKEVAYEWDVSPILGANFSVSSLVDCAIFLASVRMPFHNTTEFQHSSVSKANCK